MSFILDWSRGMRHRVGKAKERKRRVGGGPTSGMRVSRSRERISCFVRVRPAGEGGKEGSRERGVREATAAEFLEL